MKVVFTILLLLQASFASSQNFEGLIKYHTEVQFAGNQKYQDYFDDKYGEELWVWVNSSGNITKEYKGSKYLDYYRFFVDSTYSYSGFPFTDSIIANPITAENTRLLSIDTLGTDTILGYYCEVFRLNTVEGAGDSAIFWDMTVWVAPKLSLNSPLYSSCKEWHWDTISKLNEGMFLKVVTNLTRGAFWFSHTAYDIDFSRNHPEVFDLGGRDVLYLEE